MTAVNMKVTNFQLQNNDNTVFDLYQYGKDSFVLLVFFRGAWCSYCKRQLKDLQANVQEFGKLHIKIIAISSDTKLKSSLLKTFLKLDFPVLADRDFQVINQFNLKTIYKDKPTSKPAVFLISPKKKIEYEYIGQDYDDRLAAKQILINCQELL